MPMTELDGTAIRQCAAHLCDFLRVHEEADWAEARGPEVDMSVAELVAHVALTGIWYSVDLTARGENLVAVRPSIDSAAGTAALINSTSALFEMLATVVDAAPPDARGFHPFGQADASGFAAMACDEMLVHGRDIAQAMGTEFVPPAELPERVLSRLFPWAPTSGPAWDRLLWANGRIALDDHARLERWKWHCAPIAEWDGTQPG